MGNFVFNTGTVHNRLSHLTNQSKIESRKGGDGGLNALLNRFRH